MEFVSRMVYWKCIEGWEAGLKIGGKWDFEVGCVKDRKQTYNTIV